MWGAMKYSDQIQKWMIVVSVVETIRVSLDIRQNSDGYNLALVNVHRLVV